MNEQVLQTILIRGVDTAASHPRSTHTRSHRHICGALLRGPSFPAHTTGTQNTSTSCAQPCNHTSRRIHFSYVSYGAFSGFLTTTTSVVLKGLTAGRSSSGCEVGSRSLSTRTRMAPGAFGCQFSMVQKTANMSHFAH